MSLLPSGFACRRSEMMKRVMTILATALLASGVLATAAEAGGDGYMGALVATFTCAADSAAP